MINILTLLMEKLLFHYQTQRPCLFEKDSILKNSSSALKDYIFFIINIQSFKTIYYYPVVINVLMFIIKWLLIYWWGS